jgi:pimeloyl-ACP methyl ester carboxylesterase
VDDAIAAIAFGYRRLDVGLIDAAIDGTSLAATDLDSRVAVPVLVVAADEAAGAAFSTADEERLARTQPDVDVVRVTGSGHQIHGERRHRESFTEHLRRLLDTYA